MEKNVFEPERRIHTAEAQRDWGGAEPLKRVGDAPLITADTALGPDEYFSVPPDINSEVQPDRLGYVYVREPNTSVDSVRTRDILSRTRRAGRFEAQFPTDWGKDERCLEEIAALRGVTSAAARDLGLSVDDRLPTADETYFLPTGLYDDFLQVYGLPPGGDGYFSDAREAILRDLDDPYARLRATGHEYIHATHHSVYIVIKEGLFGRALSGYSYGSDEGVNYRIWDETLTEAQNLHNQFTYWRDDPVLRLTLPDTPKLLGYPKSVAFTHAIISRIAAESGQEPLEIWKPQWRGAVRGDREGLDLVAGVFGDEGLQAIKNWVVPSHQSRQRIAGILNISQEEIVSAERGLNLF